MKIGRKYKEKAEELDSKTSTFQHFLMWPTWGYITILLSILMIFVIIPLFVDSEYGFIGLQIGFVAVVLASIYTLNTENLVHRRLDLIFESILATLFVFFEVWSIFSNSLVILAVAYCISCVFLFIAILILMRRVLTLPIIDTNLICGGITVYLFFGILWAKLYFLVHLFDSTSFHAMPFLDMHYDGLEKAFDSQFNLLYYSFTTLTTLGLGDVFPLTRITRSLTMLEAMFGQLFIAIVISKLVSIWRR